jgi:short-subunit dehydrogenase
MSGADTTRRTALITGASSGIGRELAHVFARAGHNVIVTARREEALQALCRELEQHQGISAKAVVADLATPGGAEALHAAVMSTGATVDYVVNDAGLGHVGNVAALELEPQLRAIDVNVRSLVCLTRLFLPAMIERRRGAVLNIGSTAAFLPGPGMAVYFASKTFVVSFTQALAHELKGTGVSATVVCPGPTDTAFARLAGSDRLALYQGALAKPRDVAEHAYRAMLRAVPVSLHGTRTALRVNLLKLAPASLSTRLGARATRPTK